LTAGAWVAASTATVSALKNANDAFVNLATASKNLGLALGISQEDMSRWIAVGDDAGVSAKDLSTANMFINRHLAQGKEPWKAYGVATYDAAGQMRPAQDILIDILATLTEIQDPTLQAAAGMTMLGRSFAKVAPLIGSTTDEYNEYIDAVTRGQ